MMVTDSARLATNLCVEFFLDCCDIDGMVRSRLFVTLAFALALWTGAGSIAATVLASDMTLKMAMSGQITDTETDLCPACGPDETGTIAADCLNYCVFVQGAVFPPGSELRIASLSKFAVSPVSSPHETISGVEPSPPKPSILR